MTDDFEHNRFLFVKDEKMVFGCINPFCRHGNLGLPRHWKIPMITDSVNINIIHHQNRQIAFHICLKKNVGKHKAEETVEITCADNFDACKSAFADLFAGKETTTK